MAKQNKKGNKIIITLVIMGGLFLLFALLSPLLLVVLNPIKRLNDAKIANCEAKFYGDQEKILNCFKEAQVMISPTP